MQSADYTGYFAKRAGEERLAAARACDERAAQCHRDLAERYEAMAQGPQAGLAAAQEQASSCLPNDFRILP